MDILETIRLVADHTASQEYPPTASFDQLAEEVMELHLALRGKHEDTPAMEWLEIATIAINALRQLPLAEVASAQERWLDRHTGGRENPIR